MMIDAVARLALLAALLLGAAAAEDADRPKAVFLRMTTCPSCALNQMPMIKDVVHETLARGDFDNVEVRWKPGALPLVEFFDAQAEPVGRAAVLEKDMTRGELFRLFRAEFGFVPQPATAVYPDAPISGVNAGDVRFEFYGVRDTLEGARAFAAGRRDALGRQARLLSLESELDEKILHAWAARDFGGLNSSVTNVWLDLEARDPAEPWVWRRRGPGGPRVATPDGPVEGAYQNWIPTTLPEGRAPRPDTLEQKCAYADAGQKSRNGRWHATNCEARHGVVLEYRGVPDGAAAADAEAAASREEL